MKHLCIGNKIRPKSSFPGLCNSKSKEVYSGNVAVGRKPSKKKFQSGFPKLSQVFRKVDLFEDSFIGHKAETPCEDSVIREISEILNKSEYRS